MFTKNTHFGELDLDIISKKCPRSTAKLVEFMTDALLKFQQRVIEEFKNENGGSDEDLDVPELTEILVKESIINLFTSGQMRSLFEFFDRNDVLIDIIPPDAVVNWTWNIHNSARKVESSSPNSYVSRSRAEASGFSGAFEILEKLLGQSDQEQS